MNKDGPRSKRLMLIAAQEVPGAEWEYYEAGIRKFLGTAVKKVLFVPYGYAASDLEVYVALAKERFGQLGYELESVHKLPQPDVAIRDAAAIYVGGGNTWLLQYNLCNLSLLNPILRACTEGTPYIGIGAGATVACPNIRTTDDWSLVSPPSVRSLGLFPFQIVRAPYPISRHGKSLEDRIREYHQLNPEPVVALPDRSWITTDDKYGQVDGGMAVAKLFYPVGRSIPWTGLKSIS